MDQETLVDYRFVEAQKLIDCLAREGRLAVSAAYWRVTFDEDEKWTLFIISSTDDQIGRPDALMDLLGTLRAHPEIHVSRDEVQLERPDTLSVARTLEFLEKYPLTEAFRIGGVFIKGQFNETVYIYPIILGDQSAPLRTVERTAY